MTIAAGLGPPSIFNYADYMSKNRRKSKKQRVPEPDERYVSPPFILERYGRHTSIRSTFSEDDTVAVSSEWYNELTVAFPTFRKVQESRKSRCP
jgi:hypothetical protein